MMKQVKEREDNFDVSMTSIGESIGEKLGEVSQERIIIDADQFDQQGEGYDRYDNF